MSTLINKNDQISNDEARIMTAANNKRLAAMTAELDFEDIPPDAIVKVTRKVQLRLLFTEAIDPMLSTFKEELKTAVTKQDKKARNEEAAAAKEAQAPASEMLHGAAV